MGHLIGASQAMQSIFSRVGRVASSNSTVLITGERDRQGDHRSSDSQAGRACGMALHFDQLRSDDRGFLESELGHLKG